MRAFRLTVLSLVFSLAVPASALAGVGGRPTTEYRGGPPAPIVGDVGEHDRNRELVEDGSGSIAPVGAENVNDPVVVDGSLFTVPDLEDFELPEVEPLAVDPEIIEDYETPVEEEPLAGDSEVVGFVEGESVEVIEERGRTRRVYQNPDGTMTAELSNQPLNFQDADGKWLPIDNRLHLQDDGSVTNGANDWNVRFGPLAEGVSLEWGGRQIAWAPVDGDDAIPEIEPDGVSVRYRDVWPGVDLVYRMRGSGVEEFIEIRSRNARAEFGFEFGGVEFDDTGSGLVSRGEGRQLFVSPVESFDRSGKKIDGEASTGLALGVSRRSDVAQYSPVVTDDRLIDRSGEPFDVVTPMTVSLDQGWLRSQPDDVFPIVLDPTLTVGDSAAYAYKRGASGPVMDGWIRIGNPAETPTSTYFWRSVVKFDYESLFSADKVNRILSAQLTTVSGATGVAGTHLVKVFWASELGYHATTPPRESWSDVKLQSSIQCCGVTQVHPGDLQMSQMYYDWIYENQPSRVVLFTGDERAGYYTYKRFDATLKLTYNRIVNATTEGNTVANGRQITVRVNPATDLDGDIPKYKFEIWNRTDGGVRYSQWSTSDLSFSPDIPLAWYGKNLEIVIQYQDQTWASGYPPQIRAISRFWTPVDTPIDAPLPKDPSPPDGAVIDTVAPILQVEEYLDPDPGDQASVKYRFQLCEVGGSCFDAVDRTVPNWSPSESGLQLKWNTQYAWAVAISDGVIWSGWSEPRSFMPAVVSPDSEAVGAGFNPFSERVGGVDVSSGTFSWSTTDIAVATPTQDLAVSRTYNSSYISDGAFGRGWSFPFDMRAQDSDIDGKRGVTVTLPDGRKQFYGLNPDDQYASPYGYGSTLVKDPEAGVGWRVTDASQNVFDFDADGALISTTDPNGRKITTVRVNNIQLITDVTTGRSLKLTWSATTPSRVIKVETDPVVDGGATLAWDYTYSTDNSRLVAVSDPQGDITTYGYDTSNRLNSVTLPEGNKLFELTYGTDGKVTESRNGAGDEYVFAYASTKQGVDTDGNSATPEVQLWRTTVRLPNYQTEPTAEHITYYDHDDLKRLVHTLNLDAHTRKSYDDNGFVSGFTDRSGRTTLFTYDDSGNLIARSDERDLWWHFTYDDKNSLISEKNPLNQTIAYVNDLRGNRTKQTTAMGLVTEWIMTPGGTDDGYGPVPAGLLDRLIEPGNRVTERSYDSQGDLRKVVYPSGLFEEFDHDNLGRVLSKKTTISAGEWWLEEYEYDGSGRVIRTTESAVQNPVSGVTHRKQTEYSYDDNGNLITTTISDLVGGDETRVTEFEYDNADREKKVTNLIDGSTTTSMTREFDHNGNVVAVTDGLGRRTETEYNGRNLPIRTVLKAFYSPTDGLAARDIVLGEWTYYMVGLLKTSKVYKGSEAIERTYTYRWDSLATTTVKGALPGGGDLTEIRTEYDNAGRVAKEYAGNDALFVEHTRDADGRLTQSVIHNAKEIDGKGLSVDKTIKYFYDAYGFVNKKQVVGGGRTEEVRYVNDVMGNVVTETVENGDADIVIQHVYDTRGLEIHTIDAAGKQTDSTYDILGRLVKVESPQVATVSYDVVGGSLSRTAATERPTVELGYNTFGDLTHSEDASGNVTVTGYDRLGRRTLITHPAYTSPVTAVTVSPTEAYTYDLVGNLVSVKDRNDNVTTFEFDSLNRGVRQIDPSVGGLPVVSESVFDELGNLVKATDPEGAVTRYEYDKLGQMTSQIQVVDGVDLVSTFVYDLLGNVVVSNPAGYGDTDLTTRVWSPSGELLKVTSPFTDSTTTNQWFFYDVAGRNTKSVAHDGTYSLVTYDLVGREVRRGQHGVDGTELVWSSTFYDSAGRVASTSTGGGAETVYGYNDVGWLTSISEKVSASESIVTSYGYDVLGNQTETTDGEGRVWAQTYNPWGLLERRVEPATSEYPDLDERMFVTAYDAAGLPVRDVFPTGPEVVGGPDVTVEVTRVFDVLGRPVSESSGGVVSSMSYDRVGRLTSVSHPSGTVSNTYDERGLLLSSSGPAGSTSYSYDEAGRVVSRSDAAGLAQFAWWPSGGLRTMSDDVSDVVRDYQWTRLGRLQSVVFGSGAHRDYVWSEVGRLVSDSMVDEDGFESFRAAYTYTPDGFVETEVVGPVGVAGSGTHSYTYDLAGRVTSWTSPLGGFVGYTWDGAGNRLTAGAESFTYDARNRLVASGTDTNIWSARGTLLEATEDGVPKAFSFDGLGRMTAAGDVEYSYDGLGRMAARDDTDLLYSGLGIQPVSDGDTTTITSPSGAPATISDGTTVGVVVRDRHGDLVAMTDGDGFLVGSRSYDPFGGLVATVGVVGTNLGFQSSWTDPDTDLVNMGARWYEPAWATFVSRDPYSGMLRTPISLNRYTYAHANPLAYWDPLGYAAQPYMPDYVKKQLAQQQQPKKKATSTVKSSRVVGMSDALYTHVVDNGGKVTVPVEKPVPGAPVGMQQQIAQATPDPFVPSPQSTTTSAAEEEASRKQQLADFLVTIVPRDEWGAVEPAQASKRSWPWFWREPRPFGEGFYDSVKNPGGYAPYSEYRPNESLADVLDTVVIHHTGDGWYEGPLDVQRQHMRDGMADIGYHFIIGRDGTIFEGRDIGVRGHHVENQNTGRIGVVLLGDFQPGPWWDFSGSDPGPTAEQVKSAESLVSYLDQEYGLEKGVGGHRDFKKDTKCPGDNSLSLVESLKELLK